MTSKKSIVAIALACILASIFLIARAHIPGYAQKNHRSVPRNWSIGIYTGNSPFNIAPPRDDQNPVLMASDLTDIQANYVADPFLIHDGSNWYLFFEALNASSKRGEIGYATSKDGIKWHYEQIILREPFHLSYPYVFKSGKDYYMIPETRQSQSVRLYKASSFPTKWVFVKKLIDGDYVDPSIFYYNGKWWLFVGARPHWNDTLRLFYADNLTGPWKEHPRSPIVNRDSTKARPGGRVQVLDGKLIRFAQNNVPVYGSQVRAFDITKLSTKDYREEELPHGPFLKGTGKGWNANRMHTADIHRLSAGNWIASVDGYR